MKIRVQQLAFLAGTLALLEILVALGIIRPTILPPPHEILATAWTSISAGVVTPHLAATLQRVASAYAIGVGIGLPLGLLLWRMPSAVVKAIEPLMASLYAVPWIAFYPVMLVVLGLGDRPIVVISAVLATIPVAINTFIGLTGIKQVWINLALVEGCSAVQRFRKVLLPGAAPHIVGGLKLGFIYAYLGTVGTEFLRSAVGLGYLVNTSYYYFQNREMYAYVIIVVVLTVVVTQSLTVVERRVGKRFG